MFTCRYGLVWRSLPRAFQPSLAWSPLAPVVMLQVIPVCAWELFLTRSPCQRHRCKPTRRQQQPSPSRLNSWQPQPIHGTLLQAVQYQKNLLRFVATGRKVGVSTGRDANSCTQSVAMLLLADSLPDQERNCRPSKRHPCSLTRLTSKCGCESHH